MDFEVTQNIKTNNRIARGETFGFDKNLVHYTCLKKKKSAILIVEYFKKSIERRKLC